MRTPTARKLPSGSWYCRVRVGGEDVSITAPTEKAALAEAMAVKAGIKRAAREPSRKLLATAYTEYIEAKSHILSPSTIAGYRRLSRNTYQGIMGLPLSRVTQQVVQVETNRMAATASPKYVRNAHGLLSAVLHYAGLRDDLATTLPQKRKAEIVVPDTDTQAAILRAARGTEIELPVNLAMTMGLRMSEVRGLRMCHARGSRLHIAQAIVDAEDGTPVAKPPKTFSGDRWLTMTCRVKELIDAMPSDTDYLVHLSGQAIYKRFERMLSKAGIPHMRFHDLRHAYASTMLMLGVPNKYIVDRMGHASDRMVQLVYQHVMGEMQTRVDEQAASFYDSLAPQNGDKNDNE